MSSERSNERFIPTLDGWRAVAVLAVVASHGITHESSLRYVRMFGSHGVSVFFVISGFLIAGKLLEEAERHGRLDISAFYLRRFFRILPPALLYLGIVASLGAVGVLQALSVKQWASCAFFFQNYLGEFAGRVPYTGHFWSLAVEEHFYLILPAMIVALGPTRLRVWVPGLCLSALVWRVVDDHWQLGQQLFPGSHAAYRTDRCFDFLLWGVFLAIMFRHVTVRAALQKFLKLPVWMGLAAAAFAVMYLHPPVVGDTAEAALIALLLAGTVLRPQDLPGRILELSPLTFIGRISYSVYLWQQLFFVAAFRPPELLQQFPVNAVCTLACATASYYLIEKPLVNVGRHVLANRAVLVANVMGRFFPRAA